MEKLLSVKEAAEALSCSEAAIRKWVYQRRLPTVKVGRLTRLRQRDLEAFTSDGRRSNPGSLREEPRGPRSVSWTLDQVTVVSSARSALDSRSPIW